MKTLLISPHDPDPRSLAQAAEILLAGGLVVFPTDTFYGLAADPRRRDGVERVFAAKGRAAGLALPLIAADAGQAWLAAASPSALTLRLAKRFWPGPLTLVLDAAPSIVTGVLGRDGSVAIRVPNHVTAQRLAARVGFPLVSTSANRSGDPAVATAGEADAAMGDAVDLVLDAGPTPGGSPSTIVDARGSRPVLIRAGAVPFPQILEAS